MNETNTLNIPNDWEQIKLGYISKLQGGFAFQSQDFLESNGIPLIRISNITSNGISNNDLIFLPNIFFKTHKQFVLEFEDTIIAMSGATTGKTCMIKKNNIPSLLNQRVGRFLCNKNKLDKKLIYYITQKEEFKKEILKDSTGGAQPNISSNNIEKILVLIPKSLKEQERIANILTSIDNTIEKTKELIEKNKKIKDGLMQDLFTPKDDWEKDFVGNISKFEYGLGESAEENGDIVYIRITDINSDGRLIKENLVFINKNKVKLNQYLHKGDVLVARTGATYGKTYFFNENFKASYGGFLIKFILNKDIIDSKYFYQYTRSHIYWNQANNLVSGSAQPQFNANTIAKLSICYPKDLKEQERIANILSSIDNKIEKEQNYLNKLLKIKVGLMQDLLTGIKRVRL